MPKDSNKNTITAQRVVRTSFIVDIIDVIFNAIVAFITGSMVMLAETLQGLSDTISVGFVLIGLKRSDKPPSKKYPFGYGRALYFWVFISALIMFTVLAGLSFYFGWKMFTNPEPIEYVSLAYIVLVISVATNAYSFSLSFRRILGKNLKTIKKRLSESHMLESKATFVLDSMGTLAAIFGLVALIVYGITGDSRYDGLGAMAIGILMAIFGFMLLRNVKGFIIGKSVSTETEKILRDAALEIKCVENVLDLRAVAMGHNRILVNMEIHVCDNLVTAEIEKLLDEVKHNVKKRVPEVYHIQVELETPH